jgi:hypothetical protein
MQGAAHGTLAGSLARQCSELLQSASVLPLMTETVPADGSPVESGIKEALFWCIWPGLVAVGSASLVWVIMQARIRLLARKHRAGLAQLEKDFAARGASLDQLVAELRIERRRFLRRMAGPQGYETTVLTLERLYLRHVPLTGWMQEEIPLGSGEPLAEQTVLIQEMTDGGITPGGVRLIAPAGLGT